MASTEELQLDNRDNPNNMPDKNVNEHQRWKYLNFFLIAVNFIKNSFVVTVIFVCFINEIILFTWHPLAQSIGWVLLFSEGIYLLSPNSLCKSWSQKTKVRCHWILQTIGSILCILGFTVIYANKIVYEKPHFHTWHAVFGLISTICVIIACLSGVVTLYNINLKDYIKPANSRLIHRICGVLAFGIGSFAVILGLFSHWVTRHFHAVVIAIFLVGLIINAGWTVSTAVKNIARKVKSSYIYFS